MHVPFTTSPSKTEKSYQNTLFDTKRACKPRSDAQEQGYMQTRGKPCSYFFHVTGKMTMRLALKLEMSFLT